MEIRISDLFKVRKKIKESKEEKLKTQEYRIIKTKRYTFTRHSNFFNSITYDINPFIYVSRTNKDVKYIEDIEFNVKELYENQYEIGLVMKNPYIKYKEKKMIITDLIKRWEFDYYQDVDDQLTKTLERASYIPIKRVKRIKNHSINFYITLTLLFLLLLKQYSSLQLLPFVGNFFEHVNTMLIYRPYYNWTVALVYLSIAIAMYMIIVKVYFDKVLRFGLSARGFLIKERDRMLKKLEPNKKRIKKHLCRIAKNKRNPKPFLIDNIYNSTVVVRRIKRYGRTVITRVGVFTSYYHQITLLLKLLQLIHFGIIVYLIYSLIRVNQLF